MNPDFPTVDWSLVVTWMNATAGWVLPAFGAVVGIAVGGWLIAVGLRALRGH